MNMIRKNGGFTLVELIVVIAILAILAGVAVPAYSGYINSANEAADITACDAIKTAAMAALATEGEVTKIEIATGGAVTVTYTGAAEAVELTAASPEAGSPAADFQAFYTSDVPTFKTQVGTGASKDVAAKATWDNTAEAGANQGKWVFAAN